MFIESSNPQKVGDKAWLVSELLKPTTGACLTFWYSMYGTGKSVLSVNYYNLQPQGLVTIFIFFPSTLKTTREESKMSNFHTTLFQNSFVLVS